MSAVAAAITGSAVIGGYSSYKAGQAQEDAADTSAQAQVQTNQQNIEFQREIFDQQREDNAPWREVGERSLQRMEQGVQDGSFDPGRFSFNFREDPGYQFRREEGINALDASASARGRLQSGAQSRAVTEYASDLASQEYGNAFNRAADRYRMDTNRSGNRFNRLASLAQVGQTANQQTQSARNTMASRVGQSTRATGNALARGAEQAGSARASAYQGGAQSINQGMQNYLLYNQLGS